MRILRLLTTVLSAALVVLLAAALSGPAPADLEPVAKKKPTNAGKIFRWGNADWNDGFVGPLSSQWQVNRPALVRNQHGMLTLDSAGAGGDVVATAWSHTRSSGRWEARVRSRGYGSGTPYRIVWELVPTNHPHCGARGVVLAEHKIGAGRATAHFRNLPKRDYRARIPLALGNNEFHTYAVEITKDHISWFVDTKVIRTERRDGARTGAAYGVRFRLAATPGKKMQRGRMQMDWVRYYTLARKNAKSIAAPQMNLRKFRSGC